MRASSACRTAALCGGLPPLPSLASRPGSKTARWRSAAIRPSCTPDHDPGVDTGVTIVVATRNRRASLLATLRHLGSLGPGGGRCPVIVVDNGSTDGTASAVVEACPQVTVLPLSANWGSAARNVGVAR